MIFGTNEDGSGYLRLSPQEVTDFKAGRKVLKRSGDSRGDFVITVKLKRTTRKDSSRQAIRDASLTNLHYRDGVFRKFFTSPFDQHAARVGERFRVVKQICASKPPTAKEEGQDDMYLIEFEDGVRIEAFGHEVCVLKYDKCS